MKAPSNANTSGLEVVAWRYRYPLDTDWQLTGVKTQAIHEVEPLVTAASAQARIAELEALVESYRRTADLEARDGDAAEARADRLAKALEPFAAMAGAGDQRPKDDALWAGQDGLRITYGDFREARAALQQETQK